MSDYYSFNKVLSLNATYNFIVGGRGIGKTYGAKKKVIKDYLKKGAQFIYLRRYATELKGKDTFFADVAVEFDGVAFRVNGNEAQVCREPKKDPKKCKWETMGWFRQLSNAQTQKGVSYPKVKTIIFDEFIIEKGLIHYLPDETKAFNDFYSTVDRWQDRTRVLFLANALSIMNPYFVEYGIEPKSDDEMIRAYSGFVCAHFPNSREFATRVGRTRFGRFIEGSDYANYSIGNIFSDNKTMLVKKKTAEARYVFTLNTRHGTHSVWRDNLDPECPKYYLQRKRPAAEIKFTTEYGKVREDSWQLIPRNDRLLQTLRTAYSQGKMFFDSPTSRNAFIGVFER